MTEALPENLAPAESNALAALPGRVLVTGATGFIGRHLARRLVEGRVPVRALARARSDRSPLADLDVEWVEGSLGDGELPGEVLDGIGVVFHLAGLTRSTSSAEFFRVNTVGTEVLAKKSLERSSPPLFVHLSSLAAAGPAQGPPLTERDAPRPVSAYGRSKLLAEEALLACAEKGLPYVVLRPPAVYGPGDRAFLGFFRAVARGFLPLVGGGERSYSLVFVSDLVEALTRVASRRDARERVYYVAHAETVTWGDTLRAIGKAVRGERRTVPLRIPVVAFRGLAALGEVMGRLTRRPTFLNLDKAREVLQPAWTCDPTRLRDELGFEARVDVAHGMERTARWYEQAGWLAPRRGR